MKEGDYSIELIAIEEGTADVIQDGEKIASLKEGDLIGEMGLLEREPRNADVIATSPMRLIKLTHWEIRRMSEDTLRPDQGRPSRSAGRAGVADPAHSETRLTAIVWPPIRRRFLIASPAESPERRPGERGTQYVGASLAVIRGSAVKQREPVS